MELNNKTQNMRHAQKYLACASLLLIGSIAASQDVHFSQYEEAPLLLNPATTGVFKGDLRAVVNYKEQWKSLDAKFETISGSVDLKVFKENHKGRIFSEGDFISAGLVFYSDKAAFNTLKQSKIDLSIAANKIVSMQHSITAGIQAGYSQKVFDDSQLTWDNQYQDGRYTEGANSEENLNENTRFVDIAGGLLWRYRVSRPIVVNLGIAGFHLNKPRQSLVSEENDKLDRKIVIHGKAWIKLNNENFSVLPNFLYMQQRAQKEFSFGALIRYHLKQKLKYATPQQSNAVLAGINYRFNDAAVASLYFEYGKAQIGISYDLNVSGLKKVSHGMGGFELSLRYIASNLLPSPKTKNVGPML